MAKFCKIRVSLINLHRCNLSWSRICALRNPCRSYSDDKGGPSKYEVDFSHIPKENIRNFGIIAHVDHGKSTLSDRLLEFTGTIKASKENKQVLDKLPVEKERGITVKAQAVSMVYKYKGKEYLLNLIDTPGHVDFSYEVMRSLAVCQGVLLLVDANQGIQAQTVANFNLAFTSELTIIPVLNKIDLKGVDVETAAAQIESLFGYSKNEILKVSAKQGTGIEELASALIEKVPPPQGDPKAPFRALLLDSWYDRFQGVVALVMVVDGEVKDGEEIVFHQAEKPYLVRALGILNPEEKACEKLCTGQVGYIISNNSSPKDACVGDTVYHKNSKVTILPPIQQSKPMVYAGIYPADQSRHSELRSAVERLTLNDSSVHISMESSPALGQGWRLGFLGLLHMDVFCQRLDQEFDAQVIVTAPSVSYKVKIVGAKNIKLHGTEVLTITNPLLMPDQSIISEYYEPMALGTIITPDKYLSEVMSVCMDRRGVEKNTQNIDNNTVMLQYKFPLNEIIVDFYDILKSVTSGYASFDYEETGYEESNLTKMTVLLNGKTVDELTTLVHSSRARLVGKSICQRLKETIPQQLYAVSIQAAVGGKILAREDIKALKKNVLAKCYGGDITRKMKLLKRHSDKQKKLRLIGNVEVPRDAFIKILKR